MSKKILKVFALIRKKKTLLFKDSKLTNQKILLGEPLELITQETEKSDLVVSFPPFAMRAKNS